MDGQLVNGVDYWPQDQHHWRVFSSRC